MTLYEHILVATGENLHKTYSSHIFPRSDHFDRSDRTWSIKYRYVIWVTCGYTQKKVLFSFLKIARSNLSEWCGYVNVYSFVPKNCRMSTFAVHVCSCLYSYGHVLILSGYFYGIIHSIDGVMSVLITGISGHSCTTLPSPTVAVRLSPLAAAQYDLRLGARAGGRGMMQAANAPMGPWVWHGPGAIFSRSKSEVQSGSKDWLLRNGMKCICLKFAWYRHILPSEELFFYMFVLALAPKIHSRMHSFWWMQVLLINGNTHQLGVFILVYCCRWLWWAEIVDGMMAKLVSIVRIAKAGCHTTNIWSKQYPAMGHALLQVGSCWFIPCWRRHNLHVSTVWLLNHVKLQIIIRLSILLMGLYKLWLLNHHFSGQTLAANPGLAVFRGSALRTIVFVSINGTLWSLTLWKLKYLYIIVRFM